MKKLGVLFVLIAALFVVPAALAAPLVPQESPADWLSTLVTYFAGLGGFAAFIALIVNIMKRFGWVGDTQADIVAKYLNLAGLVIVGVMWFFVPDVIPMVDKLLGLLAQLGGVLLPILTLALSWPVANLVSGFTHRNVRGVWLVGYSNSR